jgi:hypothetical protein
MRRIQGFALRHALIAAIGLLSLLTVPAVAQDAKGKFTLAREVNWGSVILPPGDYIYTLENQAASALLIVRSATGEPSFMVRAQSLSTADAGDVNRLALERRGDRWFVTSLVVPELAEELHFRAPETSGELAREVSPRKTASPGQ